MSKETELTRVASNQDDELPISSLADCRKFITDNHAGNPEDGLKQLDEKKPGLMKILLACDMSESDRALYAKNNMDLPLNFTALKLFQQIFFPNTPSKALVYLRALGKNFYKNNRGLFLLSFGHQVFLDYEVARQRQREAKRSLNSELKGHGENSITIDQEAARKKAWGSALPNSQGHGSIECLNISWIDPKKAPKLYARALNRKEKLEAVIDEYRSFYQAYYSEEYPSKMLVDLFGYDIDNRNPGFNLCGGNPEIFIKIFFYHSPAKAVEYFEERAYLEEPGGKQNQYIERVRRNNPAGFKKLFFMPSFYSPNLEEKEIKAANDAYQKWFPDSAQKEIFGIPLSQVQTGAAQLRELVKQVSSLQPGSIRHIGKVFSILTFKERGVIIAAFDCLAPKEVTLFCMELLGRPVDIASKFLKALSLRKDAGQVAIFMMGSTKGNKEWNTDYMKSFPAMFSNAGSESKDEPGPSLDM